MRANSIPEANAFCEGSNLWIIKDDPSLLWWKKIDLGTKYLLSQNLIKKNNQHQQLLTPTNLNTQLNLTKRNYLFNSLLLGSEDHFLNRWILLWRDLSEFELSELIESTCFSLQTKTLRFFSDSKIIKELEARPLASSMSISYIENI